MYHAQSSKLFTLCIFALAFSKLHSPKWIWFSVHCRGIRSNYIMHHHKGTSELFIDPIKGFSNVNKDTCMYHFRLKLIKYLDQSPAFLTFWFLIISLEIYRLIICYSYVLMISLDCSNNLTVGSWLIIFFYE